jgi:hypothetical protein
MKAWRRLIGIGAGLDGEGGWRGVRVIWHERWFLAGHIGGAAWRLIFVLGNLQLVEQKFEERLLAGGILGGNVIDFLLQALEVGGGDLESVELEGGALGVQRVVVERAHDLEEGELEAHGVFDQADGLVRTLGVGGLVEDAVLAVAAGRGGAGLAVELDVLAAGSVIEFGNGHRYIPPSRGVSSENKRVSSR